MQGYGRRCVWRLAGIAALGFVSLENSVSAAPHVVIAMTRGLQNHLIAPGTINGRPATFLVDTGAARTFVRADRAAEFGIRPLEQQTREGGRLFRTGVVEDLRIGGVRVGANTVALYSAEQLRGQVPGAGGKPADGLLGLDVLRRQRAVIDCRSRRLVLPNRAAGSGATFAAGAAALGFTRIPMTLNRRGSLTVPCTINGRRGRLIVDTGTFVTGLDNDAARALGLELTPSRLTARGFDGRVRPLELTRVQDLRIGNVRIEPQQFAVIDIFGKRPARRAYIGLGRIEYYRALQVPKEGPIYGLLGNELLDRHHGVIDLESMALFLK
ncbi:hypothetical protein BH20VER2_BH20VER2_06470 [soil metagenome]|nr:aspartyl protease family protein [Chthoniobacterales bacterium]